MKNAFEVRGPVTAIFLNRKDGVSLETLVDTEDLERVKKAVAWYAYYDKTVNGYYVMGYFEDRRVAKLHRFIMNAPKDKAVDHKNRNTLINTKKNLRLATSKQNNQNQGKRKDNTSGFKGVSYVKHARKYRARVQVDGKLIHLGMFKDPADAAIVAAEARSKLHPFSVDAERRLTV